MISAMPENIVRFARQAASLPLEFVELRLAEDCSAIEMTLRTDAGNIVAILEFILTEKTPQGFDLDLLRKSWDVWRGSSGMAS